MAEPAFRSALERNPDLAQKIGVLMGDYAAIEYKLFINFSILAMAFVEKITAAEVNECFSIFYSLRSISPKCQLLTDTAAALPIEPELKAACVRVCRRIKGAARRRTDIAHCVFMVDGGQRVMRLSAAKPKPSFEALTDDYLARSKDQFRTLLQDLEVLSIFLSGPRPERFVDLLRALPLPKGMPFPAGVEVALDRPDPHALAEVKASARRLKLPSSPG